MSFTQGFATGYGLVDRTIARNRAQDRQASLDERNEVRYQEGLKYRAAQDERAQSNADRAFGLQQDQFRINQQNEQWRQDNEMFDREDRADQQAFQNSMAEKTAKLQEQQALRQKELHQYQTMKERNALADQYLQNYFTTGHIDEKGKAIIANSVHAATANRMYAIKDDVVSVMKGYGEIKDWKQLLEFANQPKTLNVVNASMRNELYAREKATGNSYEIVALEPATNGGVIPILKITDKEGNIITKRAPATRNKTSSGDDEVMVVPIQQVKQKIVDSFSFATHAANDPVLRQFVEKDADKDLARKELESKTALNDAKSLYYAQGAGKSSNTTTQKDIDKGYMAYRNSILNAVTAEKPMTKPQWMKAMGFGVNQNSAQEIDEEKINSYLSGLNKT